MAIYFNPNLPPGDPPDDELILRKMGALVLADPDAFEAQPSLSPEDDSNLDAFMSSLDDLFAEYAAEPVKPRKKKGVV